MDNTSRIDVDGDRIHLRDLFGDVREVRGTIVSADLEQNEVVIRCEEA